MSDVLPTSGFYAFVADRIRRGRMIPTALSRANSTLRYVPKEQARGALHIVPVPPTAGAPRQGNYRVAAIELAVANAFVTQFHRHLNAVVGHLASFGLYDDAGMRGVLVLGRPVARHQDDGQTVEVLRVCTDGSPNACSKLYGVARRWAKQQGRRRVITYTLPDETGASLKAAGFACTGTTDGGSWSRPSRERLDMAPTVAKTRWELTLA